MKKIILSALCTAILLAGGSSFAKNIPSHGVKMLPVFSAESKDLNRLWVGTFQLVWNDFSDNILHGPVLFKNEKSILAEKLNKQEFTKSMLSDDSYYTAYGVTSLELKAKIEKAIKEKFNETSELLDKIDWKNPNNAYLMYAMLKKDFQYVSKFDIVQKDSFNNSKEKFNYFGIDKQSEPNMYKSVDVLFYNSPWDYAVALKSDKDEVILYRTNSNKSFDSVYKTLNTKKRKFTGNKKFIAGDTLKVPYMSFKNLVNYDELCGKEIITQNPSERLYIGKAMQTADFNMNNRGVTLKSEAVLDIMKMSMPLTVKTRGRNFYFDKTFYLFMKEKDKSMPYFALRVEDMDLYKYTKEVK